MNAVACDDAGDGFRIVSAGGDPFGGAKDYAVRVWDGVAGGVPLLVELIANGTDGQKEQSAAAIRGIAVEQAYKSLIGQGANAIRPLIALARNGNAGIDELPLSLIHISEPTRLLILADGLVGVKKN